MRKSLNEWYEHLAEHHAEWYSKHMQKILYETYKTAFYHGCKHGEEKELGIPMELKNKFVKGEEE